MKKILGIYSSSRQHGIGQGLQARSLFSQRTLGAHVSPFLLLDHVTPLATSAATDITARPDVTVVQACQRLTMVRQGQVDYVDASGSRTVLTAGAVHWSILPTPCINAASDGRFGASALPGNDAIELWQLWIDLPVPYSGALAPMPNVHTYRLPDDGGVLRVLAGDVPQQPGAMPPSGGFDIWELSLRPRSLTELRGIEGRTLLLVVLSGAVLINGDQSARSGEVVMLDRSGHKLFVESQSASQVLLLSGTPLVVQ